MAFARFSEYCDVYVYATGPAPKNYACVGCQLDRNVGTYFCETVFEMRGHLQQHREAGHKIPEDVFEELRRREVHSDV